ncbi:hypothetical protein ACS0TY_009637 [Phlomoides rotata]
MATAEEGGATAKTTTMTNTSAYGGGGGGAGGKFRKKPLRKPTTPYDRPPVSLRGIDSSASWLTKVVLDPASRLISYGAHRLFASVFRKRLPPPPPPPRPQPPQKSESNHVSSNGEPEAVPNSRYGAQEPARGECSQPIISCSSRNGISELEQLLQQKTFTRSEVEHLTELLHSRAGEVSSKDDEKRNEENVLHFGRSQQFESSLLEANRNGRDRSHGVVSTPISNSKVLGNSIASPTEVAKVYMGSIPSKLSPSMLGKYSQVTREDKRLLGNMWVDSKPSSMSLTTKTAVSPGSPANGFITAQRSRGRSAIYNMARSPHFKTLKRRSYVLDDDIGSVGPIRRIRQKSNLLLSGSPHTNGVGIASDAMILSSKQKLPLIGDPEHGPRTVEEINGNSIPSTSYAQVSSEPREVAAKTFKHPEKLTSKEESSKTKLVKLHGKNFKLTSSMLRGQALRSMEDVSSAELMLSVQDDQKFESRSDATSSDAHESQEQGKVEENGPVESRVSSDMHYPEINSDPVVSLKASWVRNGASDSVVQNGASQPQYKRAFRMSALEDYVDLDDEDDLPCNGIVSPPLLEGREQLGAHLTNSMSSFAGELKLVKTTIQQEMKPPSGFASSISSELEGASSVGERSNGITTPTSDEATVAAQSAALPPSVTLFDKPKQTNDPPAVFSFSSKVADKFPSLTPESNNRTPEDKPESSSSLHNISTPTGSTVKILELENGDHMKSLAAEDRNGKSDTIPPASSNGPLVSSAPVVSFTAAANQISTSGPAIFTPSTSVSTVVPSGTGDITSPTSSSSILGAAATPTIFGGPVFKFGVSSDPPAEVSVASTMIIPAGDLKTKAVKDSTADSVGTVSQGTSVPFSFTSPPSSNTDTAPPSVSSLSSSQVFNPVAPFGLNSSASSSGTGAIVSGSGATSSMFGVNPTAFSVGSSASSTSSATPSMFSFGLGSSSSSINAVGPTGGAAPPVFNFGSSSSASASATNTTSTFSTTAVASSGGAAPPAFSFGASSSNSASVTNTTSSFTNGGSGVFNFGGSSSASSSAINSVNSDPTPSNPFGSSWQTPKAPTFGSTPTSASPATGFAFGASSAAPSSSPAFPFPTPSASQPVFGNSTSGFAASPGNNYQMNGEDSMAEDPVQSTAPSAIFRQQSVAPSPSGYMFGSTVPAPAQATNPFPFGGQQNQVAPQNPPMFQASGSLEFNAGGGSFSLGSGGGDKSGRKFVKVNRSKNRKK